MTADTPVFAVEIPHQTGIPFLQKWRSFGTGLGIEIGPENLQVTLTVVRPSGIRILDALEILRYRERPSAEWGADFQAFLDKNKITHLSATVVLPAADCISRSLALPGVPNSELAAAVRYQLDGLHPFPEEEAAHSFSRLAAPHQSHLSLAIARIAVIEDYASLFDEAGIAVASFLSPASAIYSALRILQAPPAEQFLAVDEDESGIQIYAETKTFPIYCVRFPANSHRAISSSSAQIRLPEDAPIARLASLLPQAEKLEISRPVAYAASLAGALPSQALSLNLLPVDRRKTSSPWRWVPTIVLLVLLMAIGLTLAYYQNFENQRLLGLLDAEIAKLQPRLASVRTLDSQILATQKKLDFLTAIADYPRQDLESLRELTRIMPSTSFVSRMDMTRTDIGLVGEVDQSLELLKLLDSSPYLRDSEFSSPPSRNPQGKEIFQIRIKRELPANQPPAAPMQLPVGPPSGAPRLMLPPGIAPAPPLPPGVRP